MQIPPKVNISHQKSERITDCYSKVKSIHKKSPSVFHRISVYFLAILDFALLRQCHDLISYRSLSIIAKVMTFEIWFGCLYILGWILVWYFPQLFPLKSNFCFEMRMTCVGKAIGYSLHRILIEFKHPQVWTQTKSKEFFFGRFGIKSLTESCTF